MADLFLLAHDQCPVGHAFKNANVKVAKPIEVIDDCWADRLNHLDPA